MYLKLSSTAARHIVTAWLLICLPGLAAASAASLQVDAAAPGIPVRASVLRGYNFGNWMQVAEFGPLLRQVVPSVLRFPAGDIGDNFDLTEASLDLLKGNVGLLSNPELMIQTRVFQGKPDEVVHNQPEDAAAAVVMAKARGLKVPYWEIGNEPDLYSVTRGDPAWTAERYCAVFRAQAAAIKQVDPQARIAGPAVSGALPARDRFLETFVHDCGDVVDLLTWHIYPTEGEKSDADALATVAEAERTSAQFRALWSDPQRNPLGHARQIGFGVTEYGLSWRTGRPRHIADQTGALWAAEIALRLAANGIEIAHYFAFQGTGGHGLLDLSGTPRATWYAFRMLAPLNGNFVPVRSSEPALWPHAVRAGNTLELVLINSGATDQTVLTAVPGFRLVRGETFTGAIVDSDAANRRLKPAATLTLPARSMSRLSYRALPGGKH